MFQGCHLLQTVKTEIISPYMHMFITSQHRGLEINHLLFGSGLRFLPIFLGCFPSGQRATQSNNNPRVEQTLPPSVCQPPRIITTSSVSAEPSTASLSISPARSLSLSLIWVIHEIFVILTLISEMLKGAPVRLITYISPCHCNMYANDAPTL